ncbi:NUDIX domain-containing protein [Kitasatospora sp. NPDC056651]|uniref:NUDIX domain-containing protein n=1 Tax=Kitasatospora sp. NPDC056651 TaxID=3345892 RepID=UPI0036984137
MNETDIRRPERWLRAETLITNSDQRVLLMVPRNQPSLLLPGVYVRPGEQVADAAVRGLAEQTGMHREITHHLGVDQHPANPATGDPEGLTIVCDGGDASRLEMRLLAQRDVPVGVSRTLSGHQWVPLGDLGNHVDHYNVMRIRAALDILDGGLRQPLLYIGQPASSRRDA